MRLANIYIYINMYHIYVHFLGILCTFALAVPHIEFSQCKGEADSSPLSRIPHPGVSFSDTVGTLEDKKYMDLIWVSIM